MVASCIHASGYPRQPPPLSLAKCALDSLLDLTLCFPCCKA